MPRRSVLLKSIAGAFAMTIIAAAFASAAPDNGIPQQTLTFVLSAGGGNGITAAPNFQGYIEVDCAFPFAHGFALLTDGPIGTARVGTTVPALVLPNTRTNSAEESVGQ